MARQHIYTILSTADSNKWSVIKMDRDFEQVDKPYEVTELIIPNTKPERRMLLCNCFASNKETCRHRTMFELFRHEGMIDSRRAYDFDKDKWIDKPKAAFDIV